MTTSNDELVTKLREYMKTLVNTNPEYPNDPPSFEHGVKWGFTLAYYDLEQILNEA